MIKSRQGLTLVELMVVMSIVMFVITAASRLMSSLIVQFKQQSRIAQTGMETGLGLEILRRDILCAGYGLATEFEAAINYGEASGTNPSVFNDAGSVPRAVIANNPSFDTFHDSDYLVIKSTPVAENPVAGKWHFLFSDGSTNAYDTDSRENLADDDRVVVIAVEGDQFEDRRVLQVDGSNWNTRADTPDGFTPLENLDLHIMYGVAPGSSLSSLRAPFNRADYYISTADIPKKCAGSDLDSPATGVLVKAIMDQADGALGAGMPLMECVADMQVVLILKNDEGEIYKQNATNGLSAGEIREQLKSVHVYLLAHEGQMDPNYQYPNTTVLVGEPGFGRTFDFEAQFEHPDPGYEALPTWRNYRWKVYTLTEKPANLR